MIVVRLEVLECLAEKNHLKLPFVHCHGIFQQRIIPDRVNVGMEVRLRAIPDVLDEWQEVYRVYALEVDGRSHALYEILNLKRKHPVDFKKLMKTIKLVAGSDIILGQRHVKKAQNHENVYEMKGGQARMFFFYIHGSRKAVVCTNAYWKAKPSKKEQDAAFSICQQLRVKYMASIGH